MILSIACILFLALVTYWWGNQGVFDAFLHLTCVIVSAALAVALWEPVFMLAFHSPSMAEMGWGLSLGGLFLLFLFITRLITDKTCPVRPKVARWADWVFGSAMGLVAGALTFGLTLIAAGHVASARELAGFEGWKREPGQGVPHQTDGGNPAAVCATFAGSFLNMVSVNAFAPFVGSNSLALLRPDIAADGASLLRDSVDAGKSRLGVSADGVSIAGFYKDPSFGLKAGSGAFAVLVSAKSSAFDAASGFNLSASQARLIDGSTGASVFPSEFSQREENSGDSLVRHTFDSDSDYLAAPATSQESISCLIFPAAGLGAAKGPFYLQIKGLRFALPAPTLGPEGMAKAVQSGGKAIRLADAGNAPQVPDSELRLDNGVQGVMLDKNALPGSLQERDGKLIGGAAERISRSGVTSGDVRYIEEPSGMRNVVLACSRDSAVDLFNVDRTRKDAEKVGPGGQPVLIDDKQNIYAPYGYIWKDEQRNEFEIYMEAPKEGLTLKRFNRAANSGQILIMYRVPVDTTIVAVALRDPSKSITEARMVGQAKLKVENVSRKSG